MTKRLHLNLKGRPACDRQLSLHRAENASQQDTMILAENAEKFMVALKAPKPTACRHCARVVGLIPKLTRRQPAAEDEGEESEIEMLYQELTDDEEEEE